MSHQLSPPSVGLPNSRKSSKTDRTFVLFAVVFAYGAGVFTGILTTQSITTNLSVQREISLSDRSFPTTATSATLLKMINKTREENKELIESQDYHIMQRQKLEAHIKRLQKQIQKLQKEPFNIPTPYKTGQSTTTSSITTNHVPLFPDTVKRMVVDYATIPRDEFNEILDVGVPYDQTDKGGGEEVILLYTTPDALPSIHSNTNRFGLNATRALEKCNVVKVILHNRHDHRRKGVKQCIALVPNWDSYYVHNFQRLPPDIPKNGVPGELLRPSGQKVNDMLPLRYTSRNHEDNGEDFEPVPRNDWYTRKFYTFLAEYLTNVESHVRKVQNFIHTKVKLNDQNKTLNGKQTLVVLTVNKGQSMLFHNFICYSRKHNIDLSHVVMFATDEFSYQLSQDLGIPAFYDERIYGDFPEKAANSYGDSIFAKMMIAKVICVHLILYCGYNVLFQDVDVLWFKNPLEFLQSPDLEEWDMIFQDDGSRQTRFRPYSANTGFYFVRNNDKTKFFFSALMRLGDVVSADYSHQSALVSFLNEFASWKGLRAKVYRHGVDNPFPGGVEFNRPSHRDLFRKMFINNTYPWIFHMSWTANHEDKVKHYQQMGMWYLGNDTSTCSGLNCCLKEPNYVCHYPERPSAHRCSVAKLSQDDSRKNLFWPDSIRAS